MAITSAKLKEYRRVFGMVFVVSIGCYVLAVSGVIPGSSAGGCRFFAGCVSSSGPDVAPVITAYLSGASTVIALVGLVVTTLMTLRRDKRDALRAELEMEKMRLENEKLRRDLESGASSQTGGRDDTC
jgi:hypothetical protein